MTAHWKRGSFKHTEAWAYSQRLQSIVWGCSQYIVSLTCSPGAYNMQKARIAEKESYTKLAFYFVKFCIQSQQSSGSRVNAWCKLLGALFRMVWRGHRCHCLGRVQQYFLVNIWKTKRYSSCMSKMVQLNENPA